MQELGAGRDFPPVSVYELPEIHRCPKKAYSYVGGKIIELMIGLVSDHMNFFDSQKLRSLGAEQWPGEEIRSGSAHELTMLSDILRLKTEFGADLEETPICRLIRLLSFEEIKTDEYVMPRLL